MIDFLLDEGANPDQVNNRSTTPLQEAVENENEARISLLLGMGANPDESLFRAIDTGEEEIVQMLLDRGADPDQIGDDGNTALCKVIAAKDVGMVRILLKADANPNQANKENITPLDLIIQKIRNSENKVDLKSLNGWNLEIFKLLVNYGVEFDQTNKSHLELKESFPDKHLEKVRSGRDFGEKTTPAKAATRRGGATTPLRKPSTTEVIIEV
jgi:ankyrin repeat protein